MESKRVLLIDDDLDLQKVVGARIKEWGFDLTKATTGKDGIDLVSNKNIDIIILDYKMPDMNGVSILKKIRKIDNKIPVIMFTAYPDKIIKGAEDLDISAFIPKLSVCTDVMASLKVTLEMLAKRINKQE